MPLRNKSGKLVTILDDKKDLKAITCIRHCYHGYRGMDMCGGCRGTGSQLMFEGVSYPNTENGYKRAIKAGFVPPKTEE